MLRISGLLCKCGMLVMISVFSFAACSRVSEKPLNEHLTISDIQGCTHRSPFNGQMVYDIRGIVTAKTYNGFYMQSKVPDGLDCTSDGIFIFTEKFPDVLPGDEIEVDGMIQEFTPGQIEDRNLSITEMVNPEISKISSGNLLPAEVEIGFSNRNLPDKTIDNDNLQDFNPEDDGVDFYESLESMLVRVETGVVVGPRNSFNEIVIISPEYQQANAMSSLGALIQKENDTNPERIMINLNQENTQKVNVGAELLQPITGVMDYSYGNYKIRAFGIVDFSEVDVAAPLLEFQEQALTIVTYNVENLALQDDKGRLRAIASDIVDELFEPDIVVLHEVLDDSGIEDDGTTKAFRTVERLIEEVVRQGGPDYSVVMKDPGNNQDGGIPGGNIRSVILFRPDAGISLAEEENRFGLNTNPEIIGQNNWPFSVTRKPLAALFEHEGKQFLIVAVHLTSRGLDSPLFGSVQPIERLEEGKRIAQGQQISQYLSNFQNANPAVPIILAGDINDDPWSNTLNVLTTRSLYDAGKTIPEYERFSYILDGNAIQLDHILVSEPAAIVQYVIPHLNSVYDHKLQVSDHDPVLIELDLEFWEQ